MTLSKNKSVAAKVIPLPKMIESVNGFNLNSSSLQNKESFSSAINRFEKEMQSRNLGLHS